MKWQEVSQNNYYEWMCKSERNSGTFSGSFEQKSQVRARQVWIYSKVVSFISALSPSSSVLFNSELIVSEGAIAAEKLGFV